MRCVDAAEGRIGCQPHDHRCSSSALQHRMLQHAMATQCNVSMWCAFCNAVKWNERFNLHSNLLYLGWSSKSEESDRSGCQTERRRWTSRGVPSLPSELTSSYEGQWQMTVSLKWLWRLSLIRKNFVSVGDMAMAMAYTQQIPQERILPLKVCWTAI